MREAGMTGSRGEMSKIGKRRRPFRRGAFFCSRPRRAIRESPFPSFSPESRDTLTAAMSSSKVSVVLMGPC